MIRSVPNETHNIINKNFGRLAWLYKIISQNSKTISALFQLNHMHQQILPDYEDLIALQVALAQYFSKSSSFSRVCHKPVWLTNDLSVVVPSEHFHGFLKD